MPARSRIVFFSILALLSISISLTSFGCLKRQKAPDTPWAPLESSRGDFAFDLYSTLAKNHDGNFVFSPFAIELGLTMLYAGARGETAAQIEKALWITPGEDVHSRWARDLQEINQVERVGRVTFVSASRLWGQKGRHYKNPFLELVKRNYGASFETIDFTGSSNEAASVINQWVEQETRGNINEIVTPEEMSGTLLAMIDTAYFRGYWLHHFSESSTKRSPFWVSKDRKIKVPMMHAKYDLGGYNLPEFQVLYMPYNFNKGMYVFLPREKDGLAGLESLISKEWFEKTLKQAQYDDMEVFLPRFRCELDLDLKRALMAIGVKAPFSLEQADLSGIDGTREMFLSSSVHKATIKVDEYGTEASVVTGRFGAAGVPDDPHKTFRADHPFIFLILDHKTNTILFMGRVMDPRG